MPKQRLDRSRSTLASRHLRLLSAHLFGELGYVAKLGVRWIVPAPMRNDPRRFAVWVGQLLEVFVPREYIAFERLDWPSHVHP